MVRWITCTLLFVCFCAGCANGTEAEGVIAGKDLREQFIDRVNASPRTWRSIQTDADLNAVVGAFAKQTIDAAARAGEARLLVVDEAGKPLDGVQITVERAKIIGFPLNPSLDVGHDSLRSAGVTAVKWPNRAATLEMTFSKDGYREIDVDFPSKGGRSDGDLLRHARELLVAGHLREPAEPGGPMLVILPPLQIWPPEKRANRRPLGAIVPKSLFRRKEQKDLFVEVSASPVISSRQSGMVAVPRRGTYVFVDRRGKVLLWAKSDAGTLLGLKEQDGINGVKLIGVSHYGGGSTFRVDPDAEPYQWQFYAEPVAVAEMKQTEPSDDVIVSGAVDSPERVANTRPSP